MSDLDELKAEWFEFGRESGIKEAKERIIKLLEDNNKHSLDHYFPCWLCSAIALIKGENKTNLWTSRPLTEEDEEHYGLEEENKQEYPQALPLPPKTPENTQPNWTGF